jgi:outer membrane protein assembly factor BamB
MTETRLGRLLEHATRMEPPMGPVVTEAMRAGDRLRWRRRIAAVAAIVAAVTLAATVPALAFRTSPQAAPPVAGRTGTAFIETSSRTVVAVNLATGAERTIGVPAIEGTVFYGSTLVATPDGRTVWIMNWTKITPINARTERVGPSIPLHVVGADGALIADDGTRAYVALSPRDILVVDLTTRKVLTRIKISQCIYLVLSPNGKLIYAVANQGVGIISTATNTLLRTARPGPTVLHPFSVAPDSTTAYAFSEGFSLQTGVPFTDVIRVSALTGASKTFSIANTGAAAMGPDDSLAYVAGQRALYAVNPATGRTVRRWALPERSVSGLAISPNGSTAYVFGQPRGRSVLGVLAMVNLHTGHVERLIHFSRRPYPFASTVLLQLSPDGRTVYVELQKNGGGSYAVAIAASSGRVISSATVQFPGPCPIAFGR